MLEAIKNRSRQYLTNENVFLIANLLFVSSFTISQRLTNLSLAFLGIIFVGSLFKQKNSNFGQQTHVAISFVLVLALALIAFLTLPNPTEVLSTIEKYLALALIPLVISRGPKLDLNKRSMILWGFTLALLAISFYCFVIGLNNFLFREPSLVDSNEDYFNRIITPWNYLSYERLAAPAGIHPSYFSIFISFAIFFLLSDAGHSKWKAIRVIIIVFFVVFLFLLASRTGLISFILTLVAYGMLLVKYRQISMKLILPIIILISAIFASLFYFNNYFRKRLFDIRSFEIQTTVDSWNAINLRIAIWNCNLKIAKDNIMTGIGFRDYERTECYKQFSFYPHYGTYFNAHNQFLEFIVLGGVGLLILAIFYFGNILVIAYKRNNLLFILFVFLILFNLLTECMLNRILGVLFVSYFTSFFVFIDSESTPETQS